MFDLVRHTLRFTPEGTGYRAENLALQWDPEFGAEMSGSQAALKSFAFPFSGKTWNSFSVGVTGSIAFGETAAGRGGRGGGNESHHCCLNSDGRSGLSICGFLNQALRRPAANFSCRDRLLPLEVSRTTNSETHALVTEL